MMNENTDGDSWGQLLTDFGIEDGKTEDKKIEESGGQLAAVGAELADAAEPPKQKEKKTIFSRFPKINFFGTPPEVSLDSVIEGVKSPSLGGKAFADTKLEKMPLSDERTDRQETRQENRQENRHGKSRHEKKPTGESHVWSTVASQIDTLASGKETTTPVTANQPEHTSKRRVVSMFDDPIPESDEARALKNLMEEQPQREGRHSRDFLEEESDSRPRGRGHRHSSPRQPEPEEKEIRGRGSRFKPPVEADDFPEEDFEPIGEEPRERGRRGSRSVGDTHRGRGRIHENVRRDDVRDDVHNDVHEEEWSEVDAALQYADRGTGRGERTQRDGRRQRHDNRQYDEQRSDDQRYDHQRYSSQQKPERREEPTLDRKSLDEEDNGMVMVHGSIPSWSETIGDIVLGNINRHKGSPAGKGRR